MKTFSGNVICYHVADTVESERKRMFLPTSFSKKYTTGKSSCQRRRRSIATAPIGASTHIAMGYCTKESPVSGLEEECWKQVRVSVSAKAVAVVALVPVFRKNSLDRGSETSETTLRTQTL